MRSDDMKAATSMATARDFEFCKVCNRHHQDGNRHKYFPKHLNSLSSFLSKFQSKLSDVHFFLKNPTILLPQHASRNRLWCVFCDRHVHEIGSSFVCSNAIRHLASASHLKSLKSFFWKNGASMDLVDSFVIAESELAKWKSKCNLLQKGSLNAGEASKFSAATYGPSNDIHNQIESLPINSVDQFTVTTFDESITSNGVVKPLHRYTNENYQVWTSQMDQSVKFDSPFLQNGVSSAFQPIQQSDPSSSGLMNNADCQLHHQVPSVSGGVGNVHTGAPPPWLDPVNYHDTMLQGSDTDNVKLSSQKSNKSRKLNPKRVGAAWAEKRKLELIMEEQGEMSAEKVDDCWLPNFGRVWQTGSRKLSKKEFELEKIKVSEGEAVTPSEMPVEIRPYISKKRQTDGCGTAAS